ncbi:NADPH-dependent 1-acyldihydroxyacetone phosphate reductase [[Candida] railenensis]|uniref:NADPH-dependent 1-acyldihydroxyacetone phosphate reductase n=1 Tax=[Candida] railenensis TaxID=45579 RepID=A0A9P0W1X4_9ASCO|nr:NADPH-dependent 1-acyldihydroxyacetone phosphate reductase [[Candida] railenensis]
MEKVVFISGASSGIGYAVCQEFAKSNYKIYAGSRNIESLTHLSEQFPNVYPVELDVTSTDSILRAKKVVELDNDKLDILFNNAGTPCVVPALEVDEKTLRSAFEVNVFGAINLVREFSHLVIKAKGVFAFTTSSGTLMPYPFSSINNASKSALSSYASTLALEVKPFDVKVVNFITGGVKTENLEKSRRQSQNLKKGLYVVDGKDIVSESMNSIDNSSFMTAETYAREAVKDINHALHGSDYKHEGNYFPRYRGHMARFTKAANFYFHRQIIEGMLLAGFNLKESFSKLKKQRNEKPNDVSLS